MEMGVDGLDSVRITGWKVRRVMVLTTLVTYGESYVMRHETAKQL